jgi:hypothetical protein
MEILEIKGFPDFPFIDFILLRECVARADGFQRPRGLCLYRLLFAWRSGRLRDTSFHSPIDIRNLGEVALPAGRQLGIEFAKLILSRRLSLVDQLGEFY